LMGTAIGERLLGLGHQLVVYNRTAEKTTPLRTRGAVVAPTPVEAVEASPLTILVLAHAQAIHEVLLSALDRVRLEGKTILQMGTIGREESQAIHQVITCQAGDYFEAPVLGSLAEARAGKLLVMVGGTHAQVDRWHDVLHDLGEVFMVGSIGQAATLKLALNQLIASHMTAFSLSLGLVQRSGIPEELFLEILRRSALMAPMFEKKWPKIWARNYANPNFPTRHLLKDVSLILQAARSAQLDTTVLEAIHHILQQTVEQGLGDLDYSSLYEMMVHAGRDGEGPHGEGGAFNA
ncbi:MAG: NAD(P)-dependent oxidoreductase, partial [Nitrospirae bacterium]